MLEKENAKVLVVEDLEKWQKMVSRFLDRSYTLYSAYTLEEAMDLLDKHFFHVAIIDLRLDERDTDNWQGMEIVKRITKLPYGTQSIVFTSYQTPENVHQALREYDAFDTVDKTKKGSSTEFMRTMVAKAVDKAHRLYLGCIESELGITTLIPVSRCERERLIDILEVKRLDKLQMLLQQVFGELYPVTLDPNTFQTDAGIIQAVYWSKAVGKPVLVVIGSEKAVAEYKPSEVIQGGIQHRVIGMHLQETEPPLTCAVYDLEDAEIEFFIDLPLKPTIVRKE